MRWKICRTFVALTCALAVLVIAMKTPAAASETMSSAQTMAMFDKAQIDKADFEILAMPPGALAGGFALEPYATLAQIKVGGDAIMVEKKILVDAVNPSALTGTEVAITAFATTANLFLASKTLTAEYSDEMKLAGFTLAKTPMALILRC